MSLPRELDQPEVLAYIAALLAWREGDELPQRPAQLRMPLEELMGHLRSPETRRAIVERLSVLVPAEGRQLSRAERRAKR